MDPGMEKPVMGMPTLRILFEDNHLIVAEKPRGVLSQSDYSRDPDMLTILKSYIKEKYDKLGNVFVGLVHRLDRPVGGVMVFARTSKAASRLSQQIRDRRFGKVYLAIVEGVVSSNKGTLDDYIVKDKAANKSKILTVSDEGSTLGIPKKALLYYEVLERNRQAELSLLKIVPGTGRSHQIRIQLATAGYPIHGDMKYGLRARYGPEQLNVALWAYSLEFVHPTGDRWLQFTCKPPSEYPWNIFDSGRYL